MARSAEDPWGKAFADLLVSRGYERKEFAGLLGVSEDVLGNICRGITKLKGDRRKQAATILGLNENALRNLVTDPLPTRSHTETVADPNTGFKAINVGGKVHVVRKGYRLVPIYGAIPAGPPATCYSDAISAEVMPDWDNHFDRWGRVVTGTSMLPEFQDGDIAIFESRLPADFNGVHARKDNEDTFKILRKHIDRSGEFWPTNTDQYEPFAADGWEILGVCIQRIRYGEGGVKDTREYPYGFIWRFR